MGGGFNYWTKQCGAGRYDLWRDWEPHWDNTTHATDLFNQATCPACTLLATDLGVMQEAARIVRAHTSGERDGPFFLYLAHPAPHDPLLPAPHHEQHCHHITSKATH